MKWEAYELKIKKIYLAGRKRILNFLKGRYFVVSRQKLLFLVDIHDHVSRQIEAFGLYEEKQIRHFTRLIEEFECTNFIDVGANLGLYSIYVSKHLKLDVIAFEPDKRVRNQLHANLFLNHIDDEIRVEPVALSDHTGVSKFERFSDQNRGRSRILESGHLTVQTSTLDDLLDWKGERVAIKVDIEGHEKAFVLGASRFLRNNYCLIQVEVNNSPQEVVELFRNIGYRHCDRIGHDHYFLNFCIET